MPTEMTPDQWDQQFRRQADWTRATRRYLYRRANLARASRILDVGSGTGTITEEMASLTHGQVTGVDLDPAMVAYARARGGRADYRQGDAHDLPFPAGWFDVVACHFLLLWCRDPGQVAAQMVRVTRPGGAVLVCAEPDYGGRIDYPDLPIGRWQADGLRGEGAEPLIGRQLRALFPHRATDVGVIPGLWDPTTLGAEFEREWALWDRTLAGTVPQADLARIKAADRAAIDAGERLVFMPVFYAFVQL